LKFSTYILFTGVIALLSLLVITLVQNGIYDESKIDVKPVVVVKASGIEAVVDSLNIAVASYGFVIALFPI